jgi:methyltransferase (TIGR00027 family)
VSLAGPSATAARAAALRLKVDRLPWASGDPQADERLAAFVAASAAVADGSPAGRHVDVRTRFVDRAVVTALGGGIDQVLVVGAGYDCRAWRYAAPGVRWFEVDHPATQADKLARLDALGIATAGVSFVPVDLVTDDLVRAVLAAGWRRLRRGLVVCEGVTAYLDEEVLVQLLAGLRSLAAPGTRFAASFAVAPGRTGELDERRRRLDAALRDLGEPIRSRHELADLRDLLRATGWREVVREGVADERLARSGFLLLEPS